jgi:hypothetical protein
LQTICLGWLLTMILLIFASWVARIIGMSHQCLAWPKNLYVQIYSHIPCCLSKIVAQIVGQLKYPLVGGQWNKNKNLILNISKTEGLVKRESATEYSVCSICFGFFKDVGLQLL